MALLVALLFGILAYVLVKFLLEKVPAVAGIAEIVAVVVGILVILWKIGAV